MRKGALLHMRTTKAQVSLHSQGVIGFYFVRYLNGVSSLTYMPQPNL